MAHISLLIRITNNSQEQRNILFPSLPSTGAVSVAWICIRLLMSVLLDIKMTLDPSSLQFLLQCCSMGEGKCCSSVRTNKHEALSHFANDWFLLLFKVIVRFSILLTYNAYCSSGRLVDYSETEDCLFFFPKGVKHHLPSPFFLQPFKSS